MQKTYVRASEPVYALKGTIRVTSKGGTGIGSSSVRRQRNRLFFRKEGQSDLLLLEKNNNNSKKTDAEESWVVKRKLKRQISTKKGEHVIEESSKEEEGGVLATCFGIDARKKPSNLTEHDITHVFWGPINSVRLGKASNFLFS